MSNYNKEKVIDKLSPIVNDLVILQSIWGLEDVYYRRITEALELIKLSLDDLNYDLMEEN